ncbi:SDR family NAD(P)-dependent oxidoreductase [Haloferax sp. MBLA0076]|uniref:SDR family NAD(P)-dependent oxidoreductase n=1 Tax=Haloferax litoreum TaxID=2666140 RepID=A0A6A8GFU9_9EURY|nr:MULTISPECIES: SDR family oxidoreductase [Haloferax]KAB1192227.1 SDR family oxidoreductase [Haloferax sp. CBA1148]MRX20680.1 SDR family NAD(P)-dependent oxidoreductase [Haloferax litoreum]
MHQKTVLITGCSSGIGRATALDFLDEEWEVYATARNPADIQTLGDRGANIATLDVTDQSDVDRVVDRILDEQGRIDCLVNNAGYGQMGPIEDVPTEMVHKQFDVNVYGPHRLTRAVLPHMRSQGDGTIVNVSSVVGRVSFPGGGVYAGSKFALEAMTDALRAEVEEYGIDAVLVEPGPVETQFSDRVEDQVNGGDETDGIERSGAYEKFYKLFDDTEALGGTGPGAIPPERVAEDIVNAASSTKPRARYQPGTVAQIGVLGRFLPDSWRDTLFGFARKLP